jgi:ATP adenylyltransferase/5',5'''-P-1,P-4-tetraphosphate phosphorylase II
MIRELEELFKRQVRSWPQLARGIQGLAQAEMRPVRVDWFDIFIRHIPHRVGSTTASVDAESVAKRPCFLCSGNLPPEEEGVQFGEDFTIYCNPFPIVDHHLTIAHRQHRLQRIANGLGNMLDFAAVLPEYFVIYNGPECGASAPDHMHFQAGSRGLFPIEKDTAGLSGITVPNYRRNVFLFRGGDRSALIDRMDRAIDLLAETTGAREEPLVNIAVFHERKEWVAYLFPRAKHRPEVFYTGELTVSPAALDLCGIFVVPLKQDFERITSEAIAAILREVTLPDGEFREVAEKLESES